MSGLVFHEEGHRYTFNGQPVPGVTTALKVVSAEDYKFVSAEVLAVKAAFGTAVHKVIELDCLGELDLASLDDVLVPYYLAWREFLTVSGFRPILSEGKVYSQRYSYAGQLDLYGMLNGCHSIIDAKSVTTVMPSTGPQTAAYENALKETRPDLIPPKATVNRYALQLRPALAGKKTAQWHLHRFSDPADFPVFLSSLRITNWRASFKPVTNNH